MGGGEISGESSPMLSPREAEVLGMAALGLRNTEISGRLGVTSHAVKFHLASVYRKLGVSNRTEAAVRYLADAHELAPSAANRTTRQLR